MELSLPSDVLQGLPAPDDNGLVRISVALKMTSDKKATIVEINDVPVGKSQSQGEQLDDAVAGMPNSYDIASQLLG